MVKVKNFKIKPAVKLPPPQKRTAKVVPKIQELESSDEESIVEDFEEDIDDTDYSESENEEILGKKQKVLEEAESENDETDEDDIEAEDEDEDDEPEYDLDPKSFVLSYGNDEDDDETEGDDDEDKPKNMNKNQHRPSGFFVNNIKAMKARVTQMKKNEPWINKVDVTVSEELVFPKEITESFDREAVFYKQATDGVKLAAEKLKEKKIPVDRPDDYFAEMVKSDQHMQRIRKILLINQKEKERRETVRRIRNEKKFAKKVQKEVELQKIAEKRKLSEAVKKHKKGMKGQLENLLNTKKQNNDEFGVEALNEEPAKKKSKLTRNQRDKKFGFGGKLNKRNDKESFDAIGSKPKLLRRRNKKR